MPNFKKKEKELSTHLEYWLYYLNNLANSQSIPERLAEDKVIKEAFDIAEFQALDKDKQFAYQQDLKARLDYKNVIDYAKEEAEKKGRNRGRMEGRKEGRKVGRQEGRQEGRKEGRQTGRTEGKEEEKRVLAIKLLDVLAVEIIAQKTGLSVETIKQLKSHL